MSRGNCGCGVCVQLMDAWELKFESEEDRCQRTNICILIYEYRSINSKKITRTGLPSSSDFGLGMSRICVSMRHLLRVPLQLSEAGWIYDRGRWFEFYRWCRSPVRSCFLHLTLLTAHLHQQQSIWFVCGPINWRLCLHACGNNIDHGSICIIRGRCEWCKMLYIWWALLYVQFMKPAWGCNSYTLATGYAVSNIFTINSVNGLQSTR